MFYTHLIFAVGLTDINLTVFYNHRITLKHHNFILMDASLIHGFVILLYNNPAALSRKGEKTDSGNKGGSKQRYDDDNYITFFHTAPPPFKIVFYIILTYLYKKRKKLYNILYEKNVFL